MLCVSKFNVALKRQTKNSGSNICPANNDSEQKTKRIKCLFIYETLTGFNVRHDTDHNILTLSEKKTENIIIIQELYFFPFVVFFAHRWVHRIFHASNIFLFIPFLKPRIYVAFFFRHFTHLLVSNLHIKYIPLVFFFLYDLFYFFYVILYWIVDIEILPLWALNVRLNCVAHSMIANTIL